MQKNFKIAYLNFLKNSCNLSKKLIFKYNFIYKKIDFILFRSILRLYKFNKLIIFFKL
jgi:hypothetical protein